MTHLTGSIYAVQLPEGAVDPWVMERYEDTMLGFYISDKIFGDENMMYSESIKLADTPNAYLLIGVWPGLSEQQAGEVVHKHRLKGDHFHNYIKNSFPVTLPTALESLDSLMESKGITTSVAIIEKLNV